MGQNVAQWHLRRAQRLLGTPSWVGKRSACITAFGHGARCGTRGDRDGAPNWTRHVGVFQLAAGVIVTLSPLGSLTPTRAPHVAVTNEERR